MTENHWYLVNLLGFKVVDRPFTSKKEAESYVTQYKHAPAIRSAKAVEGKADAYGYVMPKLA